MLLKGNQVKYSHEVLELLQLCLLHEESNAASAAPSTFTIVALQQLLLGKGSRQLIYTYLDPPKTPIL